VARVSNVPATILRILKGAPVERLFYCLLFSLQPIPASTAGDTCGPGTPDKRVAVEYVIDGDTVILSNDTHLRLIGINTPEINHEKPINTEPGAEAARRFLINLLNNDEAYLLVLGKEHKDRYGRLLGHLFLADGTNVQSSLLAQGLAVPLVIPPNLRFLDCYLGTAEHARKQRHGLWRLPQYQPVEVRQLDAGTRGYRIVEGEITRISESRTSVWINLGDDFALRILHEDRPRFTDPDIVSLKGRQIRARGRIYRRNNGLRMRLRHPADLFVLPRQEGNR